MTKNAQAIQIQGPKPPRRQKKQEPEEQEEEIGKVDPESEEVELLGHLSLSGPSEQQGRDTVALKPSPPKPPLAEKRKKQMPKAGGAACGRGAGRKGSKPAGAEEFHDELLGQRKEAQPKRTR